MLNYKVGDTIHAFHKWFTHTGVRTGVVSNVTATGRLGVVFEDGTKMAFTNTGREVGGDPWRSWYVLENGPEAAELARTAKKEQELYRLQREYSIAVNAVMVQLDKHSKKEMHERILAVQNRMLQYYHVEEQE